jgi:hypothetical protein
MSFASRSGDFAVTTGLTQGGVVLAKQFSATALTLEAPLTGGAQLASRVAPEGIEASADDSDGDGMSDADEALAGTDPGNWLSRLRIDSVERDDRDVLVKFLTVAGRVYQVEYSGDPGGGVWKPLTGEFVGSGEKMTAVDAKAGDLPKRFYRLRVGVATSSISGFIQPVLATRTMPVSSPFFGEPIGTGKVAAIDGDALTIESPGGASETLLPMLARAPGESGVSWLLPVRDHHGNKLQVKMQGVDLESLVSLGTSVEVSVMPTLGSLLGENLDELRSGASAAGADRVQLWKADRWRVFFHDGSSWRTPGSRVPQDGVGIAPGEGALISRRINRATRLWFSGELREGFAMVPIAPGDARLLGYTGVSDLRLENLAIPGWRSAARARRADLVRPWLGDRFIDCWFDGVSWRRVDGNHSMGNFDLELGSALFVERRR